MAALGEELGVDGHALELVGVQGGRPGIGLKRIGVDLPDGHIIVATDVAPVDRALIEFGPFD